MRSEIWDLGSVVGIGVVLTYLPVEVRTFIFFLISHGNPVQSSMHKNLYTRNFQENFSVSHPSSNISGMKNSFFQGTTHLLVCCKSPNSIPVQRNIPHELIGKVRTQINQHETN